VLRAAFGTNTAVTVVTVWCSNKLYAIVSYIFIKSFTNKIAVKFISVLSLQVFILNNLFAAILGKQNEDCCYWSVNVWC